MVHPSGYKLLLNRHSILKLKDAGLGWAVHGLSNINAARSFALWHQASGVETYLFSLLTEASRQLALNYLSQLNLQLDFDRVQLFDSTHPLPDAENTCRAFLLTYPNEELSSALTPDRSKEPREARCALLGELFLLEALLDNPAVQPFADLFDDKELSAQIDYHALTKQLGKIFESCQDNLEWQESLPELLQAPRKIAPDDLTAQVAFIVRHWAPWISEAIKLELKIALAITKEEAQSRMAGPGPSPSPLFGLGDGSEAPAAFTVDSDWMSSSVLLAKSIHVWLDQLSTRYRCTITTLYDIPDDELARVASWGFNALWLIGIWERSPASRRIKRLCGNPEAEASAYALYAYRVAAEFGGENALDNLKQRCQRYGIRLACDVVPNHTGIDSEWVQQHPDWFLQTEAPPYPAYCFSGPDLCEREGTEIRIDDGYWDHSDAAVVCEHHDQQSGRRRYIYHGNDGTHMPWNDTAQLNFLLPEVRQAMSDLIVEIAQSFSLIRFDAAMTLARKHFRRLWFPPPGGSAGVPSRSAFWMSDADFTQAFPVEFWREVVDRINREAPDTLLIAEAFWLMESYFVRNLGMHRVYNSAFMNMLKREENAKYRKILKDILAYNPEILKRYVNFMNNPDEATAVEQFGKGDKYFGVATLLATLPGLPMFGHGQIEGLREKYGMEYRRAYWQEDPDEGFVAHHERQIFPLLRIRQLFADVEHFSLYDFATSTGTDENVYAFSNGPAGEKALVVYNNAQQKTSGRLHLAAPKAAPAAEGQALSMPPLGEELGLHKGDFCRFRDLNGFEHLQSIEALRSGLQLQLDAYQHQVFHSFQVVTDVDGCWQQLHQQLQGRTSHSLDRDLLSIRHQELWQDFVALVDHGRLQALAGALTAAPLAAPVKETVKELNHEVRSFASAIAPGAECDSCEVGLLTDILPALITELEAAKLPEKLLADLWSGTKNRNSLGASLLGWMLLKHLGDSIGRQDGTLLELLQAFGLVYAWQESWFEAKHAQAAKLAMLLLKTSAHDPHPAICEKAFASLCKDPDHSGLLGINVHNGEKWFNKEGMAALAGSLALQAFIIAKGSESSADDLATIAEILRQRLARAAAVGYRLDKFLLLS